MEDLTIMHLNDVYGLNPNIPHIAFQFPRIPPGVTSPILKIHENPMREKFLQNAESLNKKLQGFQHMYQQYASGLLNMNFAGIVPPDHPLSSKRNSIELLKAENDKLLKENLELKKKLEMQSKSN